MFFSLPFPNLPLLPSLSYYFPLFLAAASRRRRPLIYALLSQVRVGAGGVLVEKSLSVPRDDRRGRRRHRRGGRGGRRRHFLLDCQSRMRRRRRCRRSIERSLEWCASGQCTFKTLWMQKGNEERTGGGILDSFFGDEGGMATESAK